MVLLAAWSNVAAQDAAAPAEPSAQQAATKPAEPAAAKPDPLQGLTFDLEKKTITVACKVAVTDANVPLEFLLCRVNSKDYESVLTTSAMPSSLHGLLLAMGLAQGKPARTVYLDGGTPYAIPPRGASLQITARWTDEQGKVHEMPVQNFLTCRTDENDENARKVALPDHWVFVGSVVLPNGVYRADLEGEMISVANFGASVIDVPFESSDNNAMLSYKANPDKIPARGTAVDLIIQVMPGAENEPHARMLVEVDRFGRFHVEGKALTQDELTSWASAFTRAHAKAEVQLRLDERALAGDIVRAQDALKFGGIWDVNQEIICTGNEPLPRTREQAKDLLADWARRFTAGQRLVANPIRDAEELLQDIRRQTEEAQAITAIWKTYAQEIAKGLEQYKASTQPSK